MTGTDFHPKTDEPVLSTLNVDGTRRWLGPSPPELDGGYVLPIEVRAFGERALVASMLVADRTGFAPATVGVASVAAVHPDDAKVQVRVRLQALGRSL